MTTCCPTRGSLCASTAVVFTGEVLQCWSGACKCTLTLLLLTWHLYTIWYRMATPCSLPLPLPLRLGTFWGCHWPAVCVTPYSPAVCCYGQGWCATILPQTPCTARVTPAVSLSRCTVAAGAGPARRLGSRQGRLVVSPPLLLQPPFHSGCICDFWLLSHCTNRIAPRFTSAHEFRKPNDARGLSLMNMAAQACMLEFTDIGAYSLGLSCLAAPLDADTRCSLSLSRARARSLSLSCATHVLLVLAFSVSFTAVSVRRSRHIFQCYVWYACGGIERCACNLTFTTPQTQPCSAELWRKRRILVCAQEIGNALWTAC